MQVKSISRIPRASHPKRPALAQERRIHRDARMQVQHLPIGSIKDNPYQTRKRYARHEIRLLARSISERGLLHPISVVKVGEGYVIVGGHRRLRAFKYLRRKTIPAIIRMESTGKDLALDLAIENVLRKDFAPAEKAQAIFQVLSSIPSVRQDLLRAFTLINQIRLAERRGGIGSDFKNSGFDASDVGRARHLLELMALSPNTATTYLRLLDLPEFIQERVVVAHTDTNSEEWLRKGFITVRMAYDISRIADNELRFQVFERVIQERIRGIHLKHIVDELLEDGAEQFRNLGMGSALKKREANRLASLGMRCFRLGSSLQNYGTTRLPLDRVCMERSIFRASLKALKQSCLELVSKANEVLDKTTGASLETVNRDFSLTMRKGGHGQLMRYTIPAGMARSLELKPGDRLQMKIVHIERKGRGSREGKRYD